MGANRSAKADPSESLQSGVAEHHAARIHGVRPSVRVYARCGIGGRPRRRTTGFKLETERVQGNGPHTLNIWRLEVLNPDFQPTLS